MGKPYAKEGPSAEDKALDLFADMMIERIQSLSGKDGWKKPWFTEGALQWPKNLNGREYNGMNAMMLLLHCEKEGYKIPRFCTFDRIQQFNKTGKKDEEQKPRVSVLKGEHSFPVMLTTFTVVNKETKEHIKWEDYKLLSQEEREKYNVYPKLQTYHVFNVAQTNLKEVRPEFWEKLEQEYSMPKVEKDEQFAFEPVDRMIADNRWICPIKPMFGDSAYFSISKNEIVMPEKRQFKDGESFYSNLFHEMGHSTGAEGQLDRIKPATFGSAEYAREELVAELTAALTAQRYGMTKHLKGDSAAYLKSWLDSLKESPQFIKTTLLDVKKATSMLTQHIDKIAMEIDQEKKAEQENGQEAYKKLETLARKRGAEVYYLHRGETVRAKSLALRCLYPEAGEKPVEERNSHSLVFDVTYGKFRMLLTGDIGVEDERKILAVEEDKKREKVTLLKAAHHGSNGSSSEEFLECFSPAFTVLSYGEGNTYGHPAPEAVERLEQTGTEIWRTADSGAVNVWTDGKRMYIKGYKKQDYGKGRDKKQIKN